MVDNHIITSKINYIVKKGVNVENFSTERYGFRFVNCSRFFKYFFRYMPYSRLKELLESRKLVFVYPSLWNDPYEILYLNTNFTIFKGYKQRRIFCLCGRNSIDNEDALWKVYSNGQEPMIRVNFNKEKLFSKIRDFAVDNNCATYYSKISYKLTRWQIRNIQNDSDLREKYLGSRFTEKKYITLMSLKRRAFEYEKECRLFIVPRDDQQSFFKNDIVGIPIDYSIFENFTINPLERIKREDKDSAVSKIKKDNYEKCVDEITQFIKSKITDAKVDCCDLYKDVRPIRRIRNLVEKTVYLSHSLR